LDSGPSRSGNQTPTNNHSETGQRGRSQQDGQTGQINIDAPPAIIDIAPTQSDHSLNSPPGVPETTRRSIRNKPRIDYNKTNRKGMQSKDNPDGFRAMLTRVVDSNKERPCPISMEEALYGPDSDKWLAAAEQEMANHSIQNTWNTPCTPPPKAHVLPGRWVLAYKYGLMGEIIRYKARWVVKGFRQIEGVDFNETFSSTLKASSWRLLLTIIAKHRLVVESSDVVAAFLESLVHEEIWVEQPYRFTDGNSRHACKLNKALYGLKQASHEWYATLYAVLLSLGFKRLEHDHCVFINPITKVIIAAYVDDLLFIARKRELIAQIKKELDKKFNIKHMGDLKDYLGMQIVRNEDKQTIQVNQTKYIKQLLNQLGMDLCSPAKSPMEQKHIAATPEGYIAPVKEKEAYQSLLGVLNWLSIMTRPDITYAVSTLSRSLQNPTPGHMNAAKRVLRYLAGTVDDGLLYHPNDNDGLEGFTDASYCDDYSTSRSTGAYIYKLFNGPVAWQSKLQKLVATSTCESEYIAATEACKEGLFLGPMLQELGYQEGAFPVSLSIDN